MMVMVPRIITVAATTATTTTPPAVTAAAAAVILDDVVALAPFLPIHTLLPTTVVIGRTLLAAHRDRKSRQNRIRGSVQG